MTAMFDIKPIDGSGNIDVEKIYSVESVLNLGRKFRIGKDGKGALKGQPSIKNKVSSIKYKKPEYHF